MSSRSRARRGTASADEIEATVVELEQAALAAELVDISDIFERLDRLPGKRAADIISARLIEGRSETPLLLLDVLPAVAGVTAGEAALRKIARTSTAADDLRMEAKRLIGWPEDGQAARRRTFLASLIDGDGAIVHAALLGASFWPMRPSLWEETIGYLDAIESDRRLALVQRLLAELPATGLPLLHAALHLPDRSVQLAVIDGLIARGYRASAGALRRLARTTADAQVRDAAFAAARRLGLAVAGSTTGAEQAANAWPELPPVVNAFATIVDGSGGQSQQVARTAPEGHGTFVSYLTVARGGLWDYVGLDRQPADEMSEVLDRFAEASPTIDVDLATVRGAIELALETNEATGTPVPPEFELWEPFCHDQYPPLDNEPLTIPILDDADAPDDQRLLSGSDVLIDHPFFASWLLSLADVSEAMGGVEPPKNGVLTDRQYVPLIEQLLDASEVDAMRGRLRRQAWLLAQDGEEEMRDMALAVSRSLGDSSPSEWTSHPFLRALIDVSVYAVVHDPMAVLEDALMSGRFVLPPEFSR